MDKIRSILQKTPSFVWVFIFPLLIIAFIGTIIGLFYLLANVEGFASVIMVLIFAVVVRGSISLEASANQSTTPKKMILDRSFWIGLGICFFALMGMAIDQPGNYLYNKPIEYLYCPEDSKLSRYVVVSNPLPGRTDMTQSFDCVDQDGEFVSSVNVGYIILVRFVEYVIVAYLVIGGFKVWNGVKRNKSNVFNKD